MISTSSMAMVGRGRRPREARTEMSTGVESPAS